MQKNLLAGFQGVLLCVTSFSTAGWAQQNANAPVVRSYMSQMRFSRDGQTLLGAAELRFEKPPTDVNDFDSRLRVYDGVTGKQKHVLPTHPILNGYRGVLFLPDFKTMFTTWGAWDIKAVDIHSYRVTDVIPVNSGAIGKFVLSEDGKTLVIGMTRSIEVRDFPSQKLRTNFSHGGQRTQLNFGPNDKEVLCWWSKNWKGVRAQCIDISTGKQVQYPRWVYRVRGSDVWQFSPDGKLVALAKGKTIEVWTTPTEENPGRKLRTMAVPFVETQALVFSPDSKRLAVGGSSLTKIPLALFNLETFLTL